MDVLHGVSMEAIEKKWDKLLEGLEGKIRRSTAIMLENQYADLKSQGAINESNNTDGTFQRALGYAQSGDFHKIAIPMVRRTFPELIAHDLVGVQPLTGPVGIAFALRFRAGSVYNGDAAINGDSKTVRELGYNAIDPAFSGAEGPSGMETKVAEALGSYTPGGTNSNPIQSAPGLGIGTGDPIKEVQFTLEKVQVSAVTRKLRSRWSLEVAQDLKAMHGLNIEEEMMDILAYEITAEIDREIVGKIRTVAAGNASSGTIAWGNTTDFDGRWEAEKYRNLYNRLVRNANKIAITTRRGPGNFVVANPTVCAALEATSAFTIAPVKNNVDTAKMGVSFIGSLDGRLKLYRDTFATADEALVGYKGNSAYDAGVIYLPYVQLQVAKATFEDSFNPAVGLMSRYAVMDSMWGAKNFYIRTIITGMP